MKVSDLRAGGRGVHHLGGKKYIAVYKAHTATLEEDRPEAGSNVGDIVDDARLLGTLKYDSRGRR